MPASKSEGTNSLRLLQQATSVAKTLAHRRWRVSWCVMNEKLCGPCVVSEDPMHWFLPSTGAVRRLRADYGHLRIPESLKGLINAVTGEVDLAGSGGRSANVSSPRVLRLSLSVR